MNEKEKQAIEKDSKQLSELFNKNQFEFTSDQLIPFVEAISMLFYISVDESKEENEDRDFIDCFMDNFFSRYNTSVVDRLFEELKNKIPEQLYVFLFVYAYTDDHELYDVVGEYFMNESALLNYYMKI